MKMTCKIAQIDKSTWRIDEPIGELHTYAYLLEGESRAMLIDTCQGLGDMAAAVHSLTAKPIFVAHTHGHLDHIGGDAGFEEVYLCPADLPVARAHSEPAFKRDMYARLEQERGLVFDAQTLEKLCLGVDTAKYRPMADGQQFDLGGRIIQVVSSPGHTIGSVCFYEAARRTLYTGDTVCAQGVLLSLPYACSVQQFMHTIQKLRGMETQLDTLHPGHHEEPLAPEILKRYEACAAALLAGRLQGQPGESAGVPCLLAAQGNIGLAYNPDHITD